MISDEVWADAHFLPIDEDGQLISDAEWVARAEAGRPMRVRLATLPPEPEEDA